MEEKKFVIELKDLQAAQHATCLKKCKDVQDDMLLCCNVSKPCNTRAHVSCIGLHPLAPVFLEKWFCPSCVQSDTGGLGAEWKKEESRLKELIAIATNKLKVNESIEQASSVQAQLDAMKFQMDAVKKELAEATRFMHERNEQLKERDEEVKKKEEEVKKRDEEARKKDEEIKKLGEENSQLKFELQAVNNIHETQDFAEIDELLEKSRLERTSGGRLSGVHFQNSTRHHGVSINESLNDGNVTLAQMCSIYPKYEDQEAQANSMRPEVLRIIRENIAKVTPFTGSSSDWATFKTCFVATSLRGHYRAVEDMERLRDLIQGEAKRMYNPEIMNPFADPVEILKKLDKFYVQKGNPVRHHIDAITNLKKIENKFDRERTLDLFTSVKQYSLLCSQHDQVAELTAESSLYAIESKMFHEHVTLWRRWAEKKQMAISVDTVAVFLEEQLRRINEQSTIAAADKPHVLYSALSESSSTHSVNNSGFSKARSRKNKFKGPREAVKHRPCLNCKNDHPLYKCPELIRASHEGRLELARKLKACECCLYIDNHTAIKCKRRLRCPVEACQIKQQHPLLHGHADELIRGYAHVGMHHVMSIQFRLPSTFYKILPGHVIAADNHLIQITLMIDCGAGLSLAEMDLLKIGGWQNKQMEVSMRWTKNIVRSEPDAALFEIQFIPYGSNYKFNLANLIAVENLDLPLQGQSAQKIKAEFPYLNGVPLPSYEPQKPQILLGLPHNKLISTIHSVKSHLGPVAELCELGWTIGGITKSELDIELIKEPLVVGFNCVQQSFEKNESMDPLMELVKYHYSFESIGIRAFKGESSLEDLQAENILKSTLKFIPELKRYEARLLWINEDCTMPNNYAMAKSRLVLAERRLKKLGLQQQIIDQFNNEKASGQIVKVSREELSHQKRVNFIPGFVTFNKNKIPVKARWVHDTAAEFKSKSLNKMLMKGPDNLLALPKAICALREEAIAYTADIKSMFNQVVINEEDQYSQLSLWRDCDDSKEPEIYKQTRLIFGPKCSPSIANAVRVTHAEGAAERFPKASDVAIHQMYMDDVCDSRKTKQEAVEVAKDLITMFSEISWPLVQFQSNSAEFLNELPEGSVSDKMVELCNGHEDETFTKVLGIFWKPSTDKFIFKLNDDKLMKKCFEGLIPCRKEVLSLVMRLFDPMGFLAHFLIRGRLILQELCRRALVWKDKIPTDLQDKWQRWLQEFKLVEKLEIPRQYTTRSTDNCNISWHVFVDASAEAYAAAVYIRFQFSDALLTRLMVAKARAAPIKYHSVPRLELMAALLGSRLLQSAFDWQRRLKPTSYVCWSDSETVLRWLYAKHIKLTHFVVPRVTEILERTNLQAWKYVPSKENIADIGTKWIDIDFSDPTHPWFTGPEFLQKTEEYWPIQPENLHSSRESDCVVPVEHEQTNQFVMLTKPLSLINPWQAGIIEGVSAKIRSNWTMLTRVLARALRFVQFKCKKKELVTSNFINPEELIRAENFLIRNVQKSVFEEEYNTLRNGKSISSKSKIFSLSPFFCQETELIRASTRLTERFPYDTRCPPILPNVHELSDAIVKHYHEKHNHAGDNAIMGAIRSRVWIIAIRRAVRRCRARCMYCIKLRAKPVVPMLAPLPEFRQDNDKLPFYYVGVDCFGPFDTYIGNSKHKRSVHGIIFTCLITRAVYLEVLESMDLDSVICAFEKLNARHGPIQHIYSDNGRNFLGAANILDENNDFHQKFKARLINKHKIQWHFQPPYTPHFGGVWERLIKDIKRALAASVGKFPVRKIALETVFAQIESNMNDRPLTDLAVTPDDLEPITPNLLLKGRNNHPFFVVEDIKQYNVASKSYIKSSQALVKTYMKRWAQEVLPELAKHDHSRKASPNLKLGDYVIDCDPSKLPREWAKGVICRVYTGRDNRVRVADVKLSSGKILERRSAYRLAKIDIRLENPAAEQHRYESKSHHVNLVTVAENSNEVDDVTTNLESKQTNDNMSSRKINSIFNKLKEQHAIMEVTCEEPLVVKVSKEHGGSSIARIENNLRLNATDYNKYHDKNCERTLFFTNLPANAGVIELYQILKVIGQPTTISVRAWNGKKAFSCFATFSAADNFKEALEISESFAVGVFSSRTFNNIKIERPNHFKRRFTKCAINWVQVGADRKRVQLIRSKVENSENLPIPLTCKEELILRVCDPGEKFEFVVYSINDLSKQQFAVAELPTIKLQNNQESEAQEDTPIVKKRRVVLNTKKDRDGAERFASSYEDDKQPEDVTKYDRITTFIPNEGKSGGSIIVKLRARKNCRPEDGSGLSEPEGGQCGRH